MFMWHEKVPLYLKDDNMYTFFWQLLSESLSEASILANSLPSLPARIKQNFYAGPCKGTPCAGCDVLVGNSLCKVCMCTHSLFYVML